MADPEKRANPSLPASDNGAAGGNGPASSGGGSSQRDEFKQRGRETAEELKGAARQQAEGLFSHQRDAAAEQADKVSSAFRKMAEEFDDQEQPLFSSYAQNVANCTGDLSQRLREKDLGGLVEQAQEYSRRQPALYFGG
ncbi:hypothetical protein BIS06_22390, partial [Halomonas sp. BBD48]|nr:hypothetical protein [Halomonas sp. BBD48]